MMTMDFMDFISDNRYNGVYIARTLSEKSEKEIKNIQDELIKLGFPKDCTENELHCTIIYSERPLIGNVELNQNVIYANSDKLSFFGELNNFLVIEIESDDLISRNRELTQTFGFISNFKYNPHITLFKKIPENLVSTLNSIDLISISDKIKNLKIELVNEYIQELE